MEDALPCCKHECGMGQQAGEKLCGEGDRAVIVGRRSDGEHGTGLDGQVCRSVNEGKSLGSMKKGERSTDLPCGCPQVRGRFLRTTDALPVRSWGSEVVRLVFGRVAVRQCTKSRTSSIGQDDRKVDVDREGPSSMLDRV